MAATASLLLALCGAGLLLPAGAAKLRHPLRTASALALDARAWTLPAVRLLGLFELGLAVVVLSVGGRLPLLVLAVVYAGFAAVARRQQRRGADCGCFGGSSSPTGRSHVVLDLVVAVAAAGAGWALPAARPAELLPSDPAVGAATVIATVVAVASAQLVLTGLNDLRTATGRVTLPAPRPTGGSS